MRRAVLCFLLLSLSCQVFGAKLIGVEQLQQQMAAISAKPDKDAAFYIGGLELTERLNRGRESELEKLLPGEKSRQALRAIADESQFRDPPANEIPQQPAPGIAAQQTMVNRVATYVSKAIPQLPNFLATRVTDQYEDTPLLASSESGGMVPYEPIHYVSTQSVEVAYRNGRESTGGSEDGNAPTITAKGLTTWGVFGPILGVVLMDAAQSTLVWSRWETSTEGMLAVFRYRVPAEKSHYEVTYCCVLGQPVSAFGSGAISSAAGVSLQLFRKLAAYHGEIAVDPGTGAIRRLLLIADMKNGEPVAEAKIMVEYGAVEVGGRSYICPLRSISASLGQSVQINPNFNMPVANQLQPMKRELADAGFKDYHIFRAEMRVLPMDR